MRASNRLRRALRGPLQRSQRLAAILALAGLLAACTQAEPNQNPYLGASHVPNARRGWEKLQTKADPSAPQDEAMGGWTARHTKISRRLPECFPAETRNLFSAVDQVVTKPGGKLEPFDYREGEGVKNEKYHGRDAIRGQNTWMLWGEGDEAFWGWLQEQGYGLVDFLVLLDSRNRDTRFKRAGVINQPGMTKSLQTIPELGLYLDQADGEAIKLIQPDTDIDADTHKLAQRPKQCHECHADSSLKLFEPGEDSHYAEIIQKLPQDGVDPAIYGYPSGVVGLRLFPNPDYFGTGDGPKAARKYWQQQVVDKGDDYYTKAEIQQDPKLVRPFRVAMSCGFCHLGPHPLNPPDDPEHPRWDNLSSTIGNQYWSPQPLFANLTADDSILFQFLKSQQPGTVDTSLVSTDHINNPNTITAVFDVDARLVRAGVNQPEDQSKANLLSPVADLPYPLAVEHDQSVTPRHTPRVLLDGADSIGAFGALSRVYLNIGTFPEEWQRCHNPIIGFVPQRPFPLATLQKNSVYWQTSERYRIPYLATFFTYVSEKSQQSIVAPMKLANVPAHPESKQVLEQERPLATEGRELFLENCAICHSSKQPAGFELAFAREWRKAPVPKAADAARFTLPATFADWEEFRHSAAYEEYVSRLRETAASGKEDFFQNNFLSTDVRIPITLVGTNSGRAVGTNGMSGQVWDNFSSDTYKHLPAVGAVRFYNPYSAKQPDEWGNNDEYYPPAGGPGYYRPASLISLWATGPYLHNNSLGLYPRDSRGEPDPSVLGRLRAFDDGIDKLFSIEKRRSNTDHGDGEIDNGGDLRASHRELTISSHHFPDPGFIYRIPKAASINFPAKFTRRVFEGVLGTTMTRIATVYLWIALTAGALLLVFIGRNRHAAFFLLLISLASAITIVLTRFDRLWWWLWLVPAVALAIALYLWLTNPTRAWSRVVFSVFAVGFAATGILLHRFVDGHLGGIHLGPIPQGTPINLVMNINPEAPMPNLIRAFAGLTRGIILSQRESRKPGSNPLEVLRVFEREAGQPLLEASKCPDFVLDRGHWFAEGLTEDEKKKLKAFLRTL